MDDFSGVFDDLMALVAVVEAGGFNAASTRFDVPVSRLSRRVAALERKMGVALLLRDARRFRVTEVGLRTYQHGVALRAGMQDAMAHARNSLDEPGGHLRVACPMAMGVAVVGPLVLEFMRQHARVRITLESTDGRPAAFSDPVDLLIQPSTEPLRDSSLVARKLMDARYLLVAAPELHAALPNTAPPDGWPVVPAIGWTFAPQADFWSLVNAAGDSAELAVASRFASDNLLLIRDAALAGVGVAQLPPALCAADVAAGRLRVVAPGWSPACVSIYALYPSRRALTLAGRLFVEALAARFEQLGPPTP